MEKDTRIRIEEYLDKTLYFYSFEKIEGDHYVCIQLEFLGKNGVCHYGTVYLPAIYSVIQQFVEQQQKE